MANVYFSGLLQLSFDLCDQGMSLEEIEHVVRASITDRNIFFTVATLIFCIAAGGLAVLAI